MQSAPLLLGHRGSGASRLVVENSFAAFDLALEHGCDGFEFDIRLTGCGRAIVCHDEVVREIKVASAGASELTDMPQLREVLALYRKRAFLNIELKVRGIEHALLGLLRETPPERDYVISSFLPEVMMELKARRAIPVGIICETPAQLMNWRSLPTDYVMAHEPLVTQNLVEDIHQAGRKIVAWTVNEQAAMLRLAKWGVDGIISDDTQLLGETFGRFPPGLRRN